MKNDFYKNGITALTVIYVTSGALLIGAVAADAGAVTVVLASGEQVAAKVIQGVGALGYALANAGESIGQQISSGAEAVINAVANGINQFFVVRG